MSQQRSEYTQTSTADSARAATFRRNRVQDATIWAANRLAAGLHATLGDRPENAFGILMYHRVADWTPGESTPTGNVTPACFRAQLKGLLDRGFESWSLGRILATIDASETVPANVFAVTFDDGYANNLLNALPILEELRVPATVYIATAFLDSTEPFPFDNWSGVRNPAVPPLSWRPLTTTECEQLGRHKLIELGAHTHTHGAFVDDAGALADDLSINLAMLRDRFGVERPTFAYPYGAIRPEMIERVRTMDLSAAVTTRAARIRPDADRYAWGRFTADQRDTARTLSAKLSGWYEPIATCLRAARRPLSAITPGGLGELVSVARPGLSLSDRTSQTA
jgi:peptidoglycan/xylan/chitin deacetylase (PgdA/CDA1 family)